MGSSPWKKNSAYGGEESVVALSNKERWTGSLEHPYAEKVRPEKEGKFWKGTESRLVGNAPSDIKGLSGELGRKGL